MKRIHTHYIFYLFMACLLAASCSDENWLGGVMPGTGDKLEIEGEIDQVAVTRVNDEGFVDGDEIGVYVVNYEGTVPGRLSTEGNHATNVRHTYNEADGKWNAAHDIYWQDKVTHADIYCYYPYDTPKSVDSYSFTVKRDQSKPTEGGEMGGYEASDFLWGKASDIAPRAGAVRISMAHCMSNIRVTLVEGSGFKSGEWASTEKNVLVSNLVREAKIDLNDGSVKPNGSAESTATMPACVNDEWRAIVVPQTVAAGTTLFTITVGGTPYKFSKEADFTYVPKKMMNFSIRVDKKAGEGQYALSIISESITAWENDLVSHDGTAKAYMTVNSTYGHLQDSIAKYFKDLSAIKNLKIKGWMDSKDFSFINYNLPNLTALNLKEVIPFSGNYDYYAGTGEEPVWDYAIPAYGMCQNSTLQRVILPDSTRAINAQSFYDCLRLTGSLVIPEGVKEIGTYAFCNCKALNGTLTLPNTLEVIGEQAFTRCGFNTELLLPESLKTIGEYAFFECKSIYGTLNLPDNLEEIKESAFAYCNGLTGNLVIPNKMKKIEVTAFVQCGFNGTLTLPNGLTDIKSSAFYNTGFVGELKIPETVTFIGEGAFYYNNFSGTIKLPADLPSLSARSFQGCSRLTGTLEIPKGIENIPYQCFNNCRNISKLILPESLSSISTEAFADCNSLTAIVSNSQEPPILNSGVFNYINKDNVMVEVPEAAVNAYKLAPGWRDFKNITAHHELTCSPSMLNTLNKKSTQTLVINAEGEWELQSKPSWCTLSQTSGSGKTEVILTVNSLANGSETRKGDIVFKLKDKYYKATLPVTQYSYQHEEDKFITLQKATKGSNGGINIVIVGDGYNAEDISNGSYLTDMQTTMKHFFDIEPYTSYRNYFNVYTAIALSRETGINTVNTNSDNRFGTKVNNDKEITCDYETVMKYVQGAPTVNSGNLAQTLVIIVPNNSEYMGRTMMWDDGSAISICPKTDLGYPLDMRGTVQHEAGGHGFGKLGDESVKHGSYIDMCKCTCCEHTYAINHAHALGWYENISITGKMQDVPWSHLLFDSRYSDVVDIYEGAAMHSRGAFRSEQSSCMSNYTPYFNAISRESIVKRIKKLAGETFSFEDFVAHDNHSATATTRGAVNNSHFSTRQEHNHPLMIKGSPVRRRARR